MLSCKEVISKTSVKNKKVLLSFEEVKTNDITIQGFPAYNINKPFHPKENNWLGFIIKHNDVLIYIAGDTDVIEEAKQLKVNIMILPVGGTCTMTDKEVAELVNLTKPGYAIPIHYVAILSAVTKMHKILKTLYLHQQKLWYCEAKHIEKISLIL